MTVLALGLLGMASAAEFTNSFDDVVGGSALTVSWDGIPKEAYPLALTGQVIEITGDRNGQNVNQFRANVSCKCLLAFYPPFFLVEMLLLGDGDTGDGISDKGKQTDKPREAWDGDPLDTLIHYHSISPKTTTAPPHTPPPHLPNHKKLTLPQTSPPETPSNGKTPPTPSDTSPGGCTASSSARRSGQARASRRCWRNRRRLACASKRSPRRMVAAAVAGR